MGPGHFGGLCLCCQVKSYVRPASKATVARVKFSYFLLDVPDVTPPEPGSVARLYTHANVQLIVAIHQVSRKVSRFVYDVLLYSDDGCTHG